MDFLPARYINKLGGRDKKQHDYYLKLFFDISPLSEKIYTMEKTHYTKDTTVFDKSDITTQKIKEHNKELKILNEKKYRIEELSAKCSASEDWMHELSMEMIDEKIEKLNRKINFFSFKPENQYNNSIDIEVIKQIPIKEVIENNIVKQTPLANTYFAPWRNERTPSLVIYPQTNSWCDFGEGQIGGSNIDFIMKLNDCSVGEAINLLKEYL